MHAWPAICFILLSSLSGLDLNSGSISLGGKSNYGSHTGKTGSKRVLRSINSVRFAWVKMVNSELYFVLIGGLVFAHQLRALALLHILQLSVAVHYIRG